jgi:hypothetical protein
MADDSINSPEYVNFSIDPEHFASGAVDSAAIDTNAVGASELANESVDSNAIIANSIGGSGDGYSGRNHIAPNSIGEDDLAPNSVGFDELQSNSVDTAQLRENSVIEVIIEDLAVTRAKLANSAVGTSKIGELQVTTSKIANLAVTAAKIADGTITSAKLAPGVGGGGYDPVTTPQDILGRISGLGVIGYSTKIGPGSPGYNISISIGNIANSVARGNHTHPANNQPPSSSIRFKKDITDYEVDGTKLLNLQAKTFKYRAGHRDQQYGDTYNRPWVLGFMAEEVLEAGIEEVIWYDNEGLPASLRYDLLSVYVVDLLKKHQNEIQSLKEEIQRLKENND